MTQAPTPPSPEGPLPLAPPDPASRVVLPVGPPLLPPTSAGSPLSSSPPLPPTAYPAPPAPVSGRGRGVRLALAAVCVGLLAGLIGGALGGALGARQSRPVALAPESRTSMPAVVDGSIASVADAVAPAVVSVIPPGVSDEEGGTGLVVRSDGYIVTNEHVLSSAGSARVTFADGSVSEAAVVGRSSDYDLAVLKVGRTGLPTAVFGDSSQVLVGDTAVALGSPLGLAGTVTAGIVSAVNRPVVAGDDEAVISAIQTDAPINPGSSGGPLVNARAEVIGINSANAGLSGSADSGSIGLGFAIPSNQARRIVDELMASGRSSVPVIGVSLDPTFEGIGARVKSVDPGGPAEAAGIVAGDVITVVDGHPVADRLALVASVRAGVPGTRMTVGVSAGGSVGDHELTLGAKTG